MKVFEAAALWWTERLRKRDDNTDVGDPHLSVLQARGMHSPPEVSPERIQAFQNLLTKRLKDAWENRRGHGMDDRDLPFHVCLEVDYEPRGLLWGIVKEMGLPMIIWPAKTKMHVYAWKLVLDDPWEGKKVLLEDTELLEKGSVEHYERCLAYTEVQVSMPRGITPEKYRAQQRDYEARVRKLGERYEDPLDEFRAEQIALVRRYSGQYRMANMMLHEEPGLPEDEIEWEKGQIVETLVAYQLMTRECQEDRYLPPEEIGRL